MSFLLLAAALAHAAEIQVIANEPVTVEVNGRVVTNRPGERGATATELAGGNHRVQLFDAQDRLITSATVTVTVQEQVRLELRRGQLSELGRGPLPSASTPTPCPEPAPPPKAPPAEPGSIQLTGIEPDNVAMWVDGTPVKHASGSFVASGVSAGTHDVRVVRGKRTLYSGPMRVYPGLVRRCVPENKELDCVYVETVVSIPPKVKEEAPVVVVTQPPPPAPPPPAAPLPMGDKEFGTLVAAVKAASFSSDKLGVVAGAARQHWFTIAQMGAVLDQMAHSSDKLEAARILAPRVVNPEEAWRLDQHLTFSSDKEAVRNLFE